MEGGYLQTGRQRLWLAVSAIFLLSILAFSFASASLLQPQPVQEPMPAVEVPQPVQAVQPEPVLQPVAPAQPVVPVQQISPQRADGNGQVQEPKKATVVAPEPAKQPEPVRETGGKVERIREPRPVAEKIKPVEEEPIPAQKVEPAKAVEKLPEPEEVQPVVEAVREPKAVQPIAKVVKKPAEPQPLFALVSLVDGVANGLAALVSALFPLQAVLDLNASDSNQSGTSVCKEAATTEEDLIFPPGGPNNGISSTFITELELGRATYVPFVETESPATSDPRIIVSTNKTLLVLGDTLQIYVDIVNEGPLYGAPRTVDAYLLVDVDPSDGANYYFFNGESFTGIPYKFPLTVPSRCNRSFTVAEYTIPASLPKMEYELLAAFTEPGTYTVIGEISRSKFTVIEGTVNHAPVIDSVEDSPYPLTAGETVTFEAHWHDVDNDKTKLFICKTNSNDGTNCTGGEWCQTVYDYTNPHSCGYATSASEVGEKRYWAFVCDDGGACSSSDWGGFIINSENRAPVIESFADIPDPVTAGKWVQFEAYWYDADEDTTKLFICKTNSNDSTNCTGGAWCQTEYYNNYNPKRCGYPTSTSDSGTKDYYVFVCDDEGLCSSSTSGTFTVSGGSQTHAPVIDSVEDFPDPVTAGEPVDFRVQWHDADGDKTKVLICKTNANNGTDCTGGRWCQIDNYNYSNPQGCGYPTSASDSGTKDYYAFVCDDHGLCSSSISGDFTVSGGSENHAPNASFTVTPGSGTVDTTFQVDASDSSDNEDSASELQVKWDWEDDGRWDTGYTTTKTAPHSYSTEGTKTIRLEVKDTGGLTDQATRSVSVNEGNEPSCGDVVIHADDVTLDEGETVYREFSYENKSGETFSVEGIDAGEVGSCPFDLGSTGNYDSSISAGGSGNYELRIEGQDVDEDESGRAYVKIRGHFSGGKDCSYDEIGEKRFTVYVNDSDSENHAPVIESVDDYPDPVDAGEEITFEVYWHDTETRQPQKVVEVGKTAGQNDLIGGIGGAIGQVIPNSADDVLNPNQPVPVKAVPLAGNDRARAFICKTDSHNGSSCSSGSWCQTSYSTSSPNSCSYETSESDSGTNDYYAFVCNDEGRCSNSEGGSFTVGGGEELSVSISPQNPEVESGEEQRFTADVSGGSGSYSYEWELSSYSGCETEEWDSGRYFYVTCTNTGSAQISRVVLLTVTSGSYSKSTSTRLFINPEDSGNLEVSISPQNPTVESGEGLRFDAEVSGGTGSYQYEWWLSSSSNCETNDDGERFYVTCTNSGSSTISRAVYLEVTSGSQDKTASTTLYIEPEGGGHIGPDIPDPCVNRCDVSGLWGCENDDSRLEETKTFKSGEEVTAYLESHGYHVVPLEWSYESHYPYDFGRAIEKGYRWNAGYTAANGTINSEGPEPDSEPTSYMIEKGYWPWDVYWWHDGC